MEFNTGYKPPKVEYADPSGYFGEFERPPPPEEKIESVVAVRDIGTSVTEGARFGTLVKTSQDAIRMGAGHMELALGDGGGQEPVGAENYGDDARQALREISKVNQVKFISTHTPANSVGNLSGFNPRERSFSDEFRLNQLEEVKKAIKFAADVAEGGAVVVHTGEFQRDMSDADWNKVEKDKDGTPQHWEFLSFQEEPARQASYLVDDRTGKLITDVRKSMVIREPEFEVKEDKSQGNRKRYVDQEGNYLNEGDIEDLFKRKPKWDATRTGFKTRKLTWEDFEERAAQWNKYVVPKDPKKYKKMTAAEMYFRSQMETRILQARGSSLYHGRGYQDEVDTLQEIEKSLEIAKKTEHNLTKEQRMALLKPVSKVKAYAGQGAQELVGSERKLPSEVLEEAKEKLKLSMKYIHEASASSDAQADEALETMDHVVTAEEYAKSETSKSYAEAGIYAMEISDQKKLKDAVYIAPENIFPEMGYGSHPEELIQLVKTGREKMVEYLTADMIEDPHGRRDKETGELIKVPNPYRRKNMTESKARKEAESHLRATLDTQHLGMWWKNFQAKAGESIEDRKKRFDKWYMKQVEKLQDADILGHVHLVDSMGAGHHHLPAGQGDLPVVKAIEHLKKAGFKGTIISEAHGENANFGPARQLTETWRAFGSPIKGSSYGISAPSPRWGDVHHHYFQELQSPYFIFGGYTPSNEWRFWSDVPLE